MEAWIFSYPYLGESRGGDVHYLSLCVGGIVTRIILADVSGHGNEVADTSTTLRELLRRFMNAKKQDRLVAELNRAFSDLDRCGHLRARCGYQEAPGTFTEPLHNSTDLEHLDL